MHKYYNKDYYPKIGEDALPWLIYRRRVRRNRFVVKMTLLGMGITVCLMIMGISQAL
jgi:hypothetical protein